MGLLNRARTQISGEVEFQGRNLSTLPPARAAEDPRQGHRDGVPGPVRVPAPDVPRRSADRRSRSRPRERRQGRRLGARGRAARSRRHPQREVARPRLPTPVLGRDATARDDRDGARPQPADPHLRRADNGARRHRAGADHRADRGRQARVRHRRRPRDARPRRRRGDRELRDGDVRRTRDGVRARLADLRAAAAPLHLGAARLDAERRAEAAAPSSRSRARLPRCSRRRLAARSIHAAVIASRRARRSCRRSSRRCRTPTSTRATSPWEKKVELGAARGVGRLGDVA